MRWERGGSGGEGGEEDEGLVCVVWVWKSYLRFASSVSFSEEYTSDSPWNTSTSGRHPAGAKKS